MGALSDALRETVERMAELDRQTADHLAASAARMRATLACLLYTSPSPRDVEEARMPSSA